MFPLHLLLLKHGAAILKLEYEARKKSQNFQEGSLTVEGVQVKEIALS